jgi:hypothetical protein
MNDLLSVILDLSLESIKSINVVKFLQDVSIFMNAYQLQSMRNQFRLYAAFPGGS